MNGKAPRKVARGREPRKESASSGRFQEIDVLRGLAALIVVASHYTSHCARYFNEAPIHVDLMYGFYAVKLFFVISGFVIYFTIRRCETWLDFGVSRFARLYPAYIVSLTLAAAIAVNVFGERMWWGGYITNATMLQEFLGFPNSDNVYWSLTVEVAFYFQMAVIMRLGWMRNIEAIALGWVLTAIAFSLLGRFAGLHVPVLVSRVFLLEYIQFFAAGIVFFRIHAEGITLLRILVLGTALVAEAVLRGLPDMWIAVIIFAIFALALSGFGRLAVSRPMLWLGSISYSLYISHRNLGYLVLDYLHAKEIPVGISLLVTFSGAMVLAVALTYLVERPAQRCLRELYEKRLRPALTSA